MICTTRAKALVLAALLLSISFDVPARLPGRSDPVLHVSVAGAVDGTVIGQSTSINCPLVPTPRSRCDVNVIAGTVVTLSAVPAPGKFFNAWQSGSVCAGQPDTCTFVMPSHPEGTVAAFTAAIPPLTQVCNGRVIVCPCACVPQICRMGIEYSFDFPNTPTVTADPNCPRPGAGIALDAAAEQFVP